MLCPLYWSKTSWTYNTLNILLKFSSLIVKDYYFSYVTIFSLHKGSENNNRIYHIYLYIYYNATIAPIKYIKVLPLTEKNVLFTFCWHTVWQRGRRERKLEIRGVKNWSLSKLSMPCLFHCIWHESILFIGVFINTKILHWYWNSLTRN